MVVAVKKKYLCNAPKPESWEAKAEALLKSLNGDEMKREQIARQSLSILNEQRKNEIKKTGPGRKSNAEHAMAFYEYLLGDKLEKEKEEEDEEENVEEAKQQHDDDDDDDDDDDERATTTNATSDAEDDTCSGSSNNNQSSSNKDDKEDDSSIDTQEFLNQHDDACDVCYMGGELICCTTCSLVFHRECLRPISKNEPIDWNCPHCIIQGLGGYKRHSKTWKRAEAGARQMKRMRIEKAGGEQEEEEEKSRGKILQHVKREKKKKKKKNTYEKEDGTKKEKNNPKTKSDAATTTTTKSKTIKSSQSLPKKERKNMDKDIQNSNSTTTTATVGAEAEASNKEKDDVSIASATSSCDNNFNNNNKKKRSNLALYKIADSYTPHCTESQLVKGRRNRKQPALYQPQLCADSRWKSDEKIDGEKINDDDDNNYDDDGDDDDNDDSIEDGDDDDHDDDKDDDDDDDGDYQDNDIVDDSKSKKEEPKKETNSMIRMEVETDNKIKEDCNVHKKDNDDIQVQQKVQNDEKVITCVDGVIIDDKKKASTTIWCNFCRDDPNIPICVFCGCRRCFGKHDKASLLLCDKCDEEYHTHCLGLTTVPLTQVWFCPNCEKKKKAVADLDSPRKSRTVISTYATDGIIQSDSSPTLDSPSRKDTSASSTTKTPKSTQTVKTPKSTSTVKTPKLKKSTTKIKVEGKKPRGRPPKNKDKIPASTPGKRGPKPKVKSASKSTPVPGRKRGRPRKEVNPTKALKLLAIAGPPRKRGRPRKVEIQPEPSANTGNLNAVHVPGKKRGPKPKPSTVTTTTTTSSTDSITDLRVETESEAPTTQEPIKVSRISGRVVKRASFHDEIDGGEQHLRGRSLTPKSQEAQMHRSKVPESEPRKKQKVVKNKEDSATIQITAAPSISESKPAKSRKIPKIQDKEDEMVDHLPPVVPVRMKPVLQSPAPAMWPPSETTTEDAYNLTNVTARENINDPPIATASAITDPGAAHKTQPSLTPLSGTNQPLVEAAKAVDPINVYPGPSTTAAHELPRSSSNIVSNYPSTPLLDPAALEAAVKALPVSDDVKMEKVGLTTTKSPRRKPGARECMQICRRFGVDIIPENHMNVLLDYCRRGKVEQLIRMRERLDCHSRFLESQLAGLEGLVMKVGESNVVVPALPDKFEPAKSIGAGAVESNNITSTLPALSTVVNIHSTKIAATISASTSTTISTDPVNEKMPASVQN